MPNTSQLKDPPLSTEHFTAKRFEIPQLNGISKKNVDEHLLLYQGYVKATNEILNRIHELSGESEKWPHELGGLQRRFAYEYDGMKNHEVFFSQFEGGPAAIPPSSPFLAQVTKDFGSQAMLIGRLKSLAMTRGTGWVMLYFCKQSGLLLPQWIDEHHIGVLNGPKVILALDMWEHAFVYDYPTSEKKKYIEAFFQNLNWKQTEKRFEG